MIDVAVPDPLSKTRQDPRDKVRRKSALQMHMLEKKLIEEFAERRAPDEWTIIDGGVRQRGIYRIPRTIGVAKSFDRTPTFTVRKGNKGTVRKDISGCWPALEYANRTPAFFAHGGKVAFWYLRLREQGEVDYPLMGVVKVEFPTPDGHPITAELADTRAAPLSANATSRPTASTSDGTRTFIRFFRPSASSNPISSPKPSCWPPSGGPGANLNPDSYADENKNQTPPPVIGKTSATERDANSSDKFNFWLAPKPDRQPVRHRPGRAHGRSAD